MGLALAFHLLINKSFYSPPKKKKSKICSHKVGWGKSKTLYHFIIYDSCALKENKSMTKGIIIKK
jgi:hypothetical protein